MTIESVVDMDQWLDDVREKYKEMPVALNVFVESLGLLKRKERLFWHAKGLGMNGLRLENSLKLRMDIDYYSTFFCDSCS